MAKQYRQTAATRIAELIARDLSGFKGDRLPPIRDLCVRYGASAPTIAAAARILEKRSLLTLNQGSRIQVCDRTASPVPLKSVPTSADALYAKFKGRIVAGVYRSGQLIPKLSYLCAEERVSRTTIRLAILKLAAEKLLCRKGRCWVVGSQDPAAWSGNNHTNSVILLLQPHSSYWNGLEQERTRKFVYSFMAEATAGNIVIMPFLTTPGSSLSIPMPQGREAILAEARALGPRYHGSIIVGPPSSSDGFEDIVQSLLALKMPVVWFDNRDFDFSSMHFDHKLFSHCHFSERAFAKAATSFLGEMGHRSAGYVSSDNEGWSARRGALLKEEGAAHTPQLEVSTTIDAIRRFKNMPPSERTLLLRHLYLKGSSPARKTLRYLVKELQLTAPHGQVDSFVSPFDTLSAILGEWGETTPGIGPGEWSIDSFRRFLAPAVSMKPFWDGELVIPLLLCEDITVLIARRDQALSQLLRKLSAIGLDIPDDISLISFDNYGLPASLLISSVDLGSAGLGYSAFHALQRDIPVNRDGKTGRIESQPHVNRTGSVARI